jgi:aryl-alcohol dehydrogenase-like predicted oxidoreductase
VPPNEPRLGLGTVQFGMDYGITNAAGRVQEEEVERILALAAEHGVRVIDTAALYGISEAVLGRALQRDVPWRIVTKTEKFAGQSDAAARLASTLRRSLDLLRRDSIYGLLAHDAGDLLGPRGPELWDAMRNARSRGQVAKIGASIYTAQEVEGLLDRYDLDLVQVPFNAVDHRLVKSGALQKLSERGVEVHARSAFLQGLLLQEPAQIAARFGALSTAVDGLRQSYRAIGLSPLEGALAAVLQRPEIHCIIIGITSSTELTSVLAALQKSSQLAAKLAIDRWTIDDETILNPAKWPLLGTPR